MMLGLAIAGIKAKRRERKRKEEARRQEAERVRERAEENARFLIEAERTRAAAAEHNRQRREREAPLVEEQARLARQRRVDAYLKERQARAAELASAAAERERREREAAEKEAARLREKYTPKPDQRMIDLFARVDALGLPQDIVTKFKQLGGNTQRELAETFGEELKDALPLYLKINPEVRPLALKWAKAGSLLDRLRACLPIEDS